MVGAILLSVIGAPLIATAVLDSSGSSGPDIETIAFGTGGSGCTLANVGSSFAPGVPVRVVVEFSPALPAGGTITINARERHSARRSQRHYQDGGANPMHVRNAAAARGRPLPRGGGSQAQHDASDQRRVRCHAIASGSAQQTGASASIVAVLRRPRARLSSVLVAA